ncbi:MAG: N-acetylmuramoyl-L-alanine amidase, partial [Nitrospinota bacterium]|nr:N-acetylmuramoyl-L-alanine amidase [Nitrospinota bacterium]
YLEHKGDNNLQKALYYYREVVADFPQNPLADDALFREGDIYLRQKKYEAARDTFAKVIRKFPQGDQASPSRKKLSALSSRMPKKAGVSQGKPRRAKKVPVEQASRKNSGPLIVIDAGHGGKDAGARSKNGLLEKHVNLAISKRLKRVLETQYHYRVIMTRTSDQFVPLEKRGEIANQNNANLFVSIHANAARRKGAYGIETYHLGVGSSERAMETAARENGEIVYTTPDTDVQRILADMITQSKMNGSSCLARFVQENLVKGMKKKYSLIKDLGVKEGPFYVLHDTNMPSILIEVGFITHQEEQRRLADFDYLERLARHIARGINRAMPLEECAPTI